MIKLDNHRKLKLGEIVRKGDFYKNKTTGEIKPVEHSIGRPILKGISSWYDFFRRNHTKKIIPQRSRLGARAATLIRPIAKNKTVANVAVVSFSYPHNHLPVIRRVNVISLDDKYLTGLERTRGWNSNGDGDNSVIKYQFKKFLRSKMRTSIVLISYGPRP